MAEVQTVTVSILGKEYQVSCQPDEVAALQQAAVYVDDKMREIKASAAVLGLDRIAVMAALNIANDYLGEEKKISEAMVLQDSEIKSLSSKLDRALNRLKVNADQDAEI